MNSDLSAENDENEDVISPIDLQAETDARAWAEQAEGRPHREPFRSRFAELVHSRTNAPRRVLELGAGPGWLAERVLKEGEVAEYVLLDFSAPMLAMAQSRLSDFRTACFVEASFKESSWTSAVTGPFDAVLAMQSVHELRHKRHHLALFRQVRSLLKPGGLFLVADGEPPDTPRTRRLYATCEEESFWMQQAGFSEVQVESMNEYKRANGELTRMYLLSGRN